jgi:hypothetical protein
MFRYNPSFTLAWSKPLDRLLVLGLYLHNVFPKYRRPYPRSRRSFSTNSKTVYLDGGNLSSKKKGNSHKSKSDDTHQIFEARVLRTSGGKRRKLDAESESGEVLLQVAADKSQTAPEGISMTTDGSVLPSCLHPPVSSVIYSEVWVVTNSVAT